MTWIKRATLSIFDQWSNLLVLALVMLLAMEAHTQVRAHELDNNQARQMRRS